MNKNYLFSIIALCFTILNTQINATTLQTVISDAETAYKNNNYTESLKLYESINKKTLLKNPEACYNMGNIYFKNNQLGRSVLFFLRAQRELPFDKDVAYNLRIVRSSVIDNKKSSKNFWNFLDNILFSITPSFLLIWIILCITGINVALILLIKSKNTYTRRIFILSFSALALPCLVLILKNFQHYDKQGVIIQKKVSVRSGPSDHLQSLFFVHEGSELSITKKTSNWSEVQFSQGFKGWIKNNTFEMI